MAKHRIRTYVAKGVEAAWNSITTLTNNSATLGTFIATVGPFDVDVDVNLITVTTNTKPVASGSNTLDIYNGTVAVAHKVMTTMTDALATYGFTAQTIQVPVTPPIIQTYQRLAAGTPFTIAFAGGATAVATPACVTVKIEYEIPVYDPTAKVTSYGAYDDGL